MFLYTYLDLEALDVVVSNPGLLVEGIGHILDGIPGLCGSLLQEGADLKGGHNLTSISHYISGLITLTDLQCHPFQMHTIQTNTFKPK